MSDLNKGRDVWMTVLFVLLLVAGLAVLSLGMFLAVTQRQFEVLALGLLTVVVPAAAYALAGRDGDVELLQLVKEQNRLLDSINERLLISDQAKRIAFRQKDRDALRQAIIEDIRVEDYDAAMALVKEMAEHYGNREEAEQFRQQVLQVMNKKREAHIQAAIAKIESICGQRNWDLARHEAARLQRLYPDYPGVLDAPDRVRRAYEQAKNQFLRDFAEAVEREDVERAMDVLKELDRYLTPEEGKPLTEKARQIIAKRKENMGVRFKMAVQERDWSGALVVGQQIVREFPNSTYATEVKGMLETIRERADAAQKSAANAS